eukprot:CAMPEP_0178922372 /NCGR_PEP_ID=MMETSP0786-20121207/16115_1 /TAXON_ID=186022 /ORGANISM="Thalassionema frauenfeldii, Strain CCMP 1798" /LENGTH=112 /DNA_ID=CAMNT_0020596725 /DNA_START=36 /DNA_END=374 /DNA_ORIENTATION=-
MTFALFIPRVCSFHHPAVRSAAASRSTAVYGIFDKFVKSMESGYAGGEDSPYAKIKEQDRKKKEEEQKRSAERRKRGFTELKDVKKKSFAKIKYDDNEKNDGDSEKKLFGLF